MKLSVIIKTKILYIIANFKHENKNNILRFFKTSGTKGVDNGQTYTNDRLLAVNVWTNGQTYTCTSDRLEEIQVHIQTIINKQGLSIGTEENVCALVYVYVGWYMQEEGRYAYVQSILTHVLIHEQWYKLH